MKIYIYILFLSFILLGCEPIFGPPPLVCNPQNYWLMQKPKHENPCELEHWEDEQFKKFEQNEINPISFDDIDEDDDEL